MYKNTTDQPRNMYRNKLQQRFNRPAWLALGALLLLLSACGGGGGGDGQQPSDGPVTPAFLPPNNDTSDGSLWSDPDTWGGNVPAAGTQVTIPVGQRVILDTDIDVSGLQINGELICAERNLNVRARWIMVHGLLQCGTEFRPYQQRLDIELVGNDPNESIMDMGTKVLGAMGGGVISLHGQERTSWLMLDGTINAGANSLSVESPPSWRVGDIIVVTSTDDNMHHAEVRQITGINGSHIDVNQSFTHRHFGEIQTFANQKRSWTLDTRAEVGLLSRNIRVRGDDSSEENGFGGHIMVMRDSSAFIAGVELYRMGQTGILARYPFHWHLTNDASGQYFKNSAITRSFSRCVTVHGTHNAFVGDNVCFDHLGHGYFLEDGGETGNVFDRNLGLLTRRPTVEQALTPRDFLDGEAAKGPATFWISNGDNTFRNNAAAGSDGLGFWYDTPERVGGASAALSRYRDVRPVNSPFKEFINNRVHSSVMSFSTCSFPSGPIGYNPSNLANFTNLTVFAGGDGAVWPCNGNQRFSSLMASDTGHAHHSTFVAPRPVGVTDSLFVANSKLSEGGRGRQRSAIGIYDFGVDIRNSHFANFDNEYGPSYLFGAREADVRFTNNPVSGLTLENSPFLYDRRGPVEIQRPSRWGATIHDEDGSFGMGAGTALVSEHPLMTDDTCSNPVGTGRICGNRYGRVEIDIGGRNLPPLTHFRSDGREVIASPHPERAHYQSVVSVNHSRYYYGYMLSAEALASTRNMVVNLDFLHPGDTVTLEFAGLPGNPSVSGSGYSAASDLNDLIFGAGRRFYRQGSSVFVKMMADGTDAWAASDELRIGW